PFVAMLALNSGISLILRYRVASFPVDGAPTAADLRPLLAIRARLGRESFAAPLLFRIQAVLVGARPLELLVHLLRTLPFGPLAFPFLGNTLLCLAVEAWRVKYGKALGNWLTVLGEFEALNALAAYAYENPADPFPELLDQGLCFHAEGLGHPLLP